MWTGDPFRDGNGEVAYLCNLTYSLSMTLLWWAWQPLGRLQRCARWWMFILLNQASLLMRESLPFFSWILHTAFRGEFLIFFDFRLGTSCWPTLGFHFLLVGSLGILGRLFWRIFVLKSLIGPFAGCLLWVRCSCSNIWFRLSLFIGVWFRWHQWALLRIWIP